MPSNGKVRCHLDQADHIYQVLADQKAMGLKPVTAPMPDRKELVENPKPVTKKEHAWVRATVGSLGYSWVTTRHAHDMKSRMRLAAVLNS